MLALDFDGLICDGLAECLLVTWNGKHELPLEEFSAAGLGRIPSHFADAFLHSRSFARHLGHFIVAFSPDVSTVTNQAEFERCYAAFGSHQVEDFVAQVSRYRDRARRERESAWVGCHQLYPGMREFLQPRAHELYIVTAKDTGSVVKILADAGVAIDPGHVFGERREKNTALREIATREGIAPAALSLVDDNLINVVDAREAGFGGVWATWGYSAPVHHELAAQKAVPRQSLSEFLAAPGQV